MTLIFTLFTFSAGTLSKGLKDKNIIYSVADYAFNLNSQTQIKNYYEYEFIGQISKLLHTSQYNGNGTDIPYTYYEVKIIEDKVGNIEEEFIIIKFYGGYDNNNTLNLIKDLELPIVGEMYLFNVNKTKLDESDGRTISNSFPVSNPFSIQKLNDKYSNYQKYNEKFTLNFHDPIDFACPEEPCEDNSNGTSFKNAISLNINGSYSYYVRSNVARYFKINSSAINYISVYTTGNTNTKGSIYDSNYNLIKSNSTVIGRGRDLTSHPNFHINIDIEKNETYYLKVEAGESGVSGPTRVVVEIDNYFKSDYNDLILNYNSVDSGRKIHYTTSTKFKYQLEYGINTWNNLDLIKFEKDSFWTVNDLDIGDEYDKDNDAFAYYRYRPLLKDQIRFNTYHMDKWSNDDIIKTVLHELGHSLGLNEFTYLESTDNVMHQGKRKLTKLGPADIGVYRLRWS